MLPKCVDKARKGHGAVVAAVAAIAVKVGTNGVDAVAEACERETQRGARRHRQRDEAAADEQQRRDDDTRRRQLNARGESRAAHGGDESSVADRPSRSSAL